MVTPLDALLKGPFREPAHAWLYEVANGTGYGGSSGTSHGQRRFADALVISLYPSRGLWFAGIEVKTARNDWLRELDNPRKAESILKWCHYWYVAAPPDVVRPEEVPETWGYYECDAKKAKLVVKAKRLEPLPPSIDFVAALLRRQAERQTHALNVARDEGRQRAEKSSDLEAMSQLRSDLLQAQREADQAKRALEWAQRDVRSLMAEREQFEQLTGVNLACRRGDLQHVAAQYNVAGLLAQYPPDRLAGRLREAAAALDGVAGLTLAPTGTEGGGG